MIKNNIYLTPENFDLAMYSLCLGTSIHYGEGCPKEAIDVLKANYNPLVFTCISKTTSSKEKALTTTSLAGKRLSDSPKTWAEVNFNRYKKELPIIVTDGNFLAVLNLFSRKKLKQPKFYYNNLTYEHQCVFTALKLDLEYVEERELANRACVILADKCMARNEVTYDSDILQYLATIPADNGGAKNYRRNKLTNYFKRHHYKANIAYINKDIPAVDYKYIFISDPKNSGTIIDYAKSNNIKIVYDRTDYWPDRPGYAEPTDPKVEEDYVIDNAEHIFCSSHYLYDTLSEDAKKKAEVIPNGCDTYIYKPLEKFEKPTVIYIGKATVKLDWDYVANLVKNNPDVDFLFYCRKPRYTNTNISGCENYPNFHLKQIIPEEELKYVIGKCHAGLIPFVKSDWTDGMLPLKIFHYANAHIPTAYLNCPECDYYPDVAFDLSKLSLKDIISKTPKDEDYEKVVATANWEEKFNYMMKVTGIDKYAEKAGEKSGENNG